MKDLKNKKVPIFKSIDTFRAGTFKYERNINYTEEIQKFIEEQGEAYDRTNQADKKKYSEKLYKNMREDYIKNEMAKRQPDLKYIKTYVPIFPFMYQTLDNGRAFKEQKSVDLYDH